MMYRRDVRIDVFVSCITSSFIYVIAPRASRESTISAYPLMAAVFKALRTEDPNCQSGECRAKGEEKRRGDVFVRKD